MKYDQHPRSVEHKSEIIRTYCPFSIRARSHIATSEASFVKSFDCASNSTVHRFITSSTVFPFSTEGADIGAAGAVGCDEAVVAVVEPAAVAIVAAEGFAGSPKPANPGAAGAEKVSALRIVKKHKGFPIPVDVVAAGFVPNKPPPIAGATAGVAAGAVVAGAAGLA